MENNPVVVQKNEIIMATGNSIIKIPESWIKKRDEILIEVKNLASIENSKDFENGEILLKKVGNISDELETERKKLVQPYQKKLKDFKTITDGEREELETEKKNIKDKLVEYDNKVEAKRRAEEEEKARKLAEIEAERLRVEKEKNDKLAAIEAERVKAEKEADSEKLKELEIERLRTELESKEKEICPFDEIIIEQEKPKIQSVSRLMSSVRIVPQFRIVNPAIVPIEYQSPDAKIINKALNNGIRNIPGIEIWEEKKIQAR